MHIVCILFPNLTQLDLTGPYEVFHRAPGATVHLAAASTAPVPAEGGLQIVPTCTFDDAPPADVVFVPGGFGANDAMLDQRLLDFVRQPARWYTSACTGALILGAAGLLAGYNAATHWSAMHYLASFGATAVRQRVVVDRRHIGGSLLQHRVRVDADVADRHR
jgi:cyclohexyl-isocyanide hydratase